MCGTISCEHAAWEVMPAAFSFYRDPEEVEKEEQAAAKAGSKEEFQGNRLHNFLSSLLLRQKWQTGLRECRCPLDPSSSTLPTEDWSTQLANEDWSAAPTA